jgi:hypothetical protein
MESALDRRLDSLDPAVGRHIVEGAAALQCGTAGVQHRSEICLPCSERRRVDRGRCSH